MVPEATPSIRVACVHEHSDSGRLEPRKPRRWVRNESISSGDGGDGDNVDRDRLHQLAVRDGPGSTDFSVVCSLVSSVRGRHLGGGRCDGRARASQLLRRCRMHRTLGCDHTQLPGVGHPAFCPLFRRVQILGRVRSGWPRREDGRMGPRMYLMATTWPWSIAPAGGGCEA